jgi:SSS family solute:Na+ symporter
MMMAFYMFVACLILQITFTKVQPKLAGEDMQALYWEHPLDALKAPGWPGILNYKILAGIVVCSMTVLYILFH